MLRSYKDAAEYGLEEAIGINGEFMNTDWDFPREWRN